MVSIFKADVCYKAHQHVFSALVSGRVTVEMLCEARLDVSAFILQTHTGQRLESTHT